jgi:hypothetical protein
MRRTMMAHYRIENTRYGPLGERDTMNFSDRPAAMDAWDWLVDEAEGGDKLRLIDLETGKVMSTYAPVLRGEDKT